MAHPPSIGLGAIALLTMVALSMVAAVLLPKGARVPMQWGLTGRPTWFASKWTGVTFIPLCALIVAGLGFLIAKDPTQVRPALDNLLPLFLYAHAIYLFLAIRHVERANKPN